jgi:IclR family KDG regulon transcriptional repressor
VTTLHNAVSVLRQFSADRLELSVTDTSRFLGIPKSTASRLLKSMREAGLLSTVGNTSRYRVGHLLFEVARLHRVRSNLVGLVDECLSTICKHTRHTGYVSILDGADVLVIRIHPGTNALRVMTPLGFRTPAFATATGRTLLARLTDKEVGKLHSGPWSAPSPKAPQSLRELLDRLGKVRALGWCEAVDEAIPGVDSIAVSVSDIENAETLSFCLSFSAALVPDAEKRKIITTLTDAAREIGGRVDDPKWLSHPPVPPDAVPSTARPDIDVSSVRHLGLARTRRKKR